MKNVTQFVKRWRSELAGAALVSAAVVNAGLVHGTSLRVAGLVIALATAAGVYRKKQTK